MINSKYTTLKAALNAAYDAMAIIIKPQYD